MRTHQYYVSLRRQYSRFPVLVSVYADTLDEAKTLAHNILNEEQYRMHVAVIKRVSKDGEMTYRDAVGFLARRDTNSTPEWFPWKTNNNSHLLKGD